MQLYKKNKTKVGLNSDITTVVINKSMYIRGEVRLKRGRVRSGYIAIFDVFFRSCCADVTLCYLQDHLNYLLPPDLDSEQSFRVM